MLYCTKAKIYVTNTCRQILLIIPIYSLCSAPYNPTVEEGIQYEPCTMYAVLYSLVYTIHSLGRIPQFDKASLLYWLSSHLHQILCLRSTPTKFTKYHRLLLYFNYSNFDTIPIPYPLIKKSICSFKWVQLGNFGTIQAILFFYHLDNQKVKLFL